MQFKTIIFPAFLPGISFFVSESESVHSSRTNMFLSESGGKFWSWWLEVLEFWHFPILFWPLIVVWLSSTEILQDFLDEILNNLDLAKNIYQKSNDEKSYLTSLKNTTGIGKDTSFNACFINVEKNVVIDNNTLIKNKLDVSGVEISNNLLVHVDSRMNNKLDVYFEV